MNILTRFLEISINQEIYFVTGYAHLSPTSNCEVHEQCKRCPVVEGTRNWKLSIFHQTLWQLTGLIISKKNIETGRLAQQVQVEDCPHTLVPPVRVWSKALEVFPIHVPVLVHTMGWLSVKEGWHAPNDYKLEFKCQNLPSCHLYSGTKSQVTIVQSHYKGNSDTRRKNILFDPSTKTSSVLTDVQHSDKRLFLAKIDARLELNRPCSGFRLLWTWPITNLFNLEDFIPLNSHRLCTNIDQVVSWNTFIQ